MMNYDGHMFFTGGGFMWIFWVLILVAIFFVFLNMMKGNSNRSAFDKESPLEILQKRYARGDIDDVEFERRRKELEN